MRQFWTNKVPSAVNTRGRQATLELATQTFGVAPFSDARLLALRRIDRIRFAKVSKADPRKNYSYKHVVPIAEDRICRGRDPL